MQLYLHVKRVISTLYAPLYDELGTENFPLYDGARGTRLSPTIIQYIITLRGMKHSDCNECEV